MMFSEVRLNYLCKYIISCITNFYSKSEGKELILCQDDHSGNEVIASWQVAMEFKRTVVVCPWVRYCAYYPCKVAGNR